MKNIIITTLLTCSIILSCSSQKNSSSISISNSSNGKNSQTKVFINDEHGSLSFTAPEQIGFADDEQSIDWLEKGSTLKFKRNGRRINAEMRSDGNMYYSYNGGEYTQQLSEEGAAFLAKAIKTMIGYGVGAKSRAEKLFEKGGQALVLQEVKLLKSSYTQAIYLNILLNQPNLNSEQLGEILQTIDTHLNSDYEKAKILKENAPQFLQSNATTDIWLKAVSNIGSDYEKANTLKEVLNKPLSSTQFTAIIKTAASIGSDYEKATLLNNILNNNQLNANQFSELIKCSGSISSDYEKTNVLKNAINNHHDMGAAFHDALAVMNTINSDYEKAGIIKKVADNCALSPNQWATLIGICADINSDFEKSGALIAVAKQIPNDNVLKTLLRKAARTINSEYELGRVTKSIAEMP